MNKIDWKRFSNGQKQILVKGVASTKERKDLVGEAIGQILRDPKTALKCEYLGYKQYEAFGDQRCDCSYGMGPRHGGIVFSVGRSSNYDENADHSDTIYFLKCFRDAPGRRRPTENGGGHYFTDDNIQKVFRDMRDLEEESAKLQEFLDAIVVDENEEEIIPL